MSFDERVEKAIRDIVPEADDDQVQSLIKLVWDEAERAADRVYWGPGWD